MRIELKDPVLELYYRRASSQLTYWLSVLGYNVHDRSLSNRFYLIYFCAFWGAWILVMFFLLGYILNIALKTSGTIGLLQHSALLFTYILIGWVVFQLWSVSGRSPFMFSEEDSYLLCETPVNRRTVGLARFFLSWSGTFLLFTGLTAVIAFTRVESGLQEEPSIVFIGHYFGASLRALCIIIPMQMGLHASLWGIGALRISPPLNRQSGTQRWLRGCVLVLLFLLVGSFFIPDLHSFILSPLATPIQAALGESEAAYPWIAGFGISLLYLVGGLILLNWLVKNISLNQAARETVIPSAVRTARSLWSFDLANALILQQHLEGVQSYRRLPVGKGWRTLVWKDAVQSLRSIRLGVVFQWGLLFLWSVVMFSKTNWVVQLVAAGTWTIQAGTLTNRGARKDLSRWWLFRSLPIRIIDKIKADIALPMIGATLIGWLALFLSGQPFVPSLLEGILVPLLVVNAALANLHDIFRHVETRLLLTPGIAEENVPQSSVEGLLGLLVSTLFPYILVLWQIAHPAQTLAVMAAILVAGAIAFGLMRSVKAAYRWIE